MRKEIKEALFNLSFDKLRVDDRVFVVDKKTKEIVELGACRSIERSPRSVCSE